MDDVNSNVKLLERFLKDAILRGWSEWAIKSCKYSLLMFFEQIGKSCLNVDMDDLRNYLIYLQGRPGKLGKKKPAHATIKKHIDNLASFYQYLEFEELVVKSPIPKFRVRYVLPLISNKSGDIPRQIISVRQMSELISSTADSQEKALICLMAKTGIRVGELMAIDLENIDWGNQSIKLKPTGKRTNLTVFFDNECANCLKRWLNTRKTLAKGNVPYLFVIPSNGRRINHTFIIRIVERNAARIGLHDDKSADLGKRFTPHCCRHWFTTHMRKGGMPREYIKELRGDTRGETIDIYDHIDMEELKMSYMECVPQLGI
ncbi:MAG: site-specific integrase [Thermoplasmata archaeon]|nr:site-specific integrase [Thermoplasmata archaeon]